MESRALPSARLESCPGKRNLAMAIGPAISARAGAVLAALAFLAFDTPCSSAQGTAPIEGVNAANSDEAPAPPDAPRRRHRRSAAPKLTDTSTLAEWNAARPANRNALAVSIARTRLPPAATKLELATAAMEITGCVTKTASDARFAGWQVGPTAASCLTAPETPPEKPR